MAIQQGLTALRRLREILGNSLVVPMLLPPSPGGWSRWEQGNEVAEKHRLGDGSECAVVTNQTNSSVN
jgi:hypothetical protein